MATFNPNVRVNLQTLVYIAKYYGQENVEKAIGDKYFGSVSLEQAQKAFFQLPDFQAPELRSLEFNAGWNEQTFRHLIEHFKTIRTDKGLLVDLVNQAVHDNDTTLLEGLTRAEAHEPTPAHPINVRETTPPHEDAYPPQTTHPTTESSHEDTNVAEADQPSDEPYESENPEREESQERSAREEAVQNQRGQNRAYQTNQRQNPNQRQNYNRQPAPGEKTQEKPVEGESAKDKVRRQRGQNRPSRRRLPVTPRPTPPTGGGLLNNYLNFRDLAKGGQWAAEKLGFRGLSNTIGKLLAPEKWLGNLARGALRAGGQLARTAISGLGRGLANLGGRLAGQAAGAVGRSIVTSVGGALAGVSLTAILVWIAIIGLVIITIFYLYDGYSECGKPGTVVATKSTDKESYSEGENIQYHIVVTYSIKCPNAYADIEVKDIIPPNTTFIPGSASGAIAKSLNIIPFTGYSYLPWFAPDGKLDGNTLSWKFDRIAPNQPNILVFSVKPDTSDIWISNQATIGYKTYTAGLFGLGGGATGVYSDATGLLPNPSTPTPSNWSEVRALVTGAFDKHPELIDRYKQASEQTGIAWQLLAGIHFVEKGNGPGPDTSLVSGRVIGQVEPDISPAKCATGESGPGIPVPIGGGCGFTTQVDSMIYAAKHLAEKIGKIPSTFQEAVTALSRYNGGGNANCGEGLSYQPCPPQFSGEDDPYAMADFDETHSDNKMYVIFCGDKVRCSPPKIFGRPGVMGVVRALIEEGR